jgi:hypothetical protein
MEANHPGFLPRLVPHIFNARRSNSKKTMSRRSRSSIPMSVTNTKDIEVSDDQFAPRRMTHLIRTLFKGNSNILTRILLESYQNNTTRYLVGARRLGETPIPKEMKKFWLASSILSSIATPSPPRKSCWTFTPKVHTTTTQKRPDCRHPHRWHHYDLHLLQGLPQRCIWRVFAVLVSFLSINYLTMTRC